MATDKSALKSAAAIAVGIADGQAVYEMIFKPQGVPPSGEVGRVTDVTPVAAVAVVVCQLLESKP